MELVTVKNKYQVVIPQALRNKMKISVGDLLEAKLEKGKITFTPKSVLDRELDESIADMKAGRGYGPFATAEEMIDDLKSRMKKSKNTK